MTKDEITEVEVDDTLYVSRRTCSFYICIYKLLVSLLTSHINSTVFIVFTPNERGHQKQETVSWVSVCQYLSVRSLKQKPRWRKTNIIINNTTNLAPRSHTQDVIHCELNLDRRAAAAHRSSKAPKGWDILETLNPAQIQKCRITCPPNENKLQACKRDSFHCISLTTTKICSRAALYTDRHDIWFRHSWFPGDEADWLWWSSPNP